MRYLIAIKWNVACMGICREVALFIKVGDVVCVYASSDACCEDGECYIPSGVFKSVHQCLVF